MKHMIAALFTDNRDARHAIADLKDKGYGQKSRYIDDPAGTAPLKAAGLSIQRIRQYIESLEHGNVVVTVMTEHTDEQRVMDTLSRHGPSQTEIVHTGVK